jgi:hypothetical protein
MRCCDDAAWLSTSNNEGYGLLPLPTGRDEEISALIRQWMTLNVAERRETPCSIGDEQRTTLLAYSERMASLAVRKSDGELILLGLLALGLDGWRTDWRDNVLLLCLHFDACQKIGIEANDIFKHASTLLPSNVGSALTAFLNRSPEDQSLDVMGYKESSDSDGFRYARTW